MTIYQKTEETPILEDIKLPRGGKIIRLAVTEETYEKMIKDYSFFSKILIGEYERYPELFPRGISGGFESHGFTATSKKLGIKLRRIQLKANGEVYTVAPSYIMPYMTGYTKDVSNALFLQRFGVPYWALMYVFGKDQMYYYRQVNSIGRNSIVGTTVRNKDKLPKHLVGDEKHTKRRKDKVYIATTVGDDCILGASVSPSADEKGLTQAYGHFEQEAKNVAADYKPETINTDGWGGTGLAWKKLFPNITIIGCFLHAFLKIKERCKKYSDMFKSIGDKAWGAYEATTRASFMQRLRRLREWAEEVLENGIVKDKTLALCNKGKKFAAAYNHPGCHRTSNGVDRLMRWLDQYLFNAQYFHGTLNSAEQGVRAWAILRNFQPYCIIKNKDRTTLLCAAQKLNGFAYSDNWLENLIVSTSMCGYRQ